MNSDFIL